MPSKARRAPPTARPALPRWLSHRNLLVVESLLVVGLAQEAAEDWLVQAPVPAWLRVVLVMGLVVGLFAGVVVVVERGVRHGLHTSHAVAKRLPLPFPVVALHVVALVGLFAAYAWARGLDAAVLVELGLRSGR